MKHVTVLILLSLSLVFTILNVINSVRSATYVNLLGITAIAPILMAFYQESDWLYVHWNRVTSYLKNQTARFEMTFYIEYDSDFLLDDKESLINELNKVLNSTLSDLNIKFQRGGKRKFDGNYAQFRVKTKENLEFSIEMSNDHISTLNNVAIKLKFQVSSRSIDKCWKLSKSFRDKFLSRVKNTTQRTDLVIDMSNSRVNPFYRLTFKFIKAKKIENFGLSFMEDNLQIKLKQYEIYATSTEISDLDRVVKEYIPLTKVG